MSLVITSQNVLLPAHTDAQPATIYVDLQLGKISRVHLCHSSKADCPDGATFIDYGDLYILPGLVECVVPHIAKLRLLIPSQCPCPPQRARPH
jgi:allantoinase